ncbi:helix-turn-helix transcriptional regulator [Bacillus pseudomycoides]
MKALEALKVFGQNVKRFRQSRGLTQAELGNELNLSRNQINNCENALFEPSVETMLRISFYFNVPLDVLFGITNAQNEEMLHDTLNEVQRTYAALDEPQRESFCRQLSSYAKYLAQNDELLR